MARGAWCERFALPGVFCLLLVLAAVANKAIVPLLAIAAIRLVPAALRGLHRRPVAWRPSPGAVLYAAFLGWGLLSMVWSINPSETVTRIGRLAGISLLGAVVLYGMAQISTVTKRRILDACMIGFGAALVIIAARYVWIREAEGTIRYPEGINPLSALNPALTMLAVLIWPVALRIAVRSSWIVAAVAIAVYGLPLMFLTSASSVLALAIGAIGFAASAAWPRAAPRVAAALLCLTMLTAPLITLRLTGDAAFMEMLEPLPGSVRHRAFIWDFVAHHVVERPILGWGLESSRHIPGGKERPPVGYEYLPLHPHNAALQIWLELGAVGALIAALMTVSLILKAAEGTTDRWGTAAASAAILSFAVVALTAYGAFQSWWIAFAWLLAAALAALRPSGTTAPHTSP